MKLQDLLPKNAILTDIKKTDKNEVLRDMTHFMASLYNLNHDPEILTQKILEREAEISTGIGYGIAIPHVRLAGIDRCYMAAARSKTGIDFNAIDDQPVHMLFMLFSPVNTSTEHTQILSSLSRIMTWEEIREKLLQVDEAQEFLDVLTEGENKYIG
ncbi:phosphotransferase system mannitol/fructose-specifc IIA component [Chitinispirillum alkaliphilum]|nr:phosphotransferase system mannitol/fructose-specifc IIA component [Chitinispirillum alkaliphilum]